MGNNGCMGQLIGPFKKNDELYTYIEQNTNGQLDYVSHIGIQMDNHTSSIPGEGIMIYINNKAYEIGKTGIYEIGNTKITSLYFSDAVDDKTIIDYTVVLS